MSSQPDFRQQTRWTPPAVAPGQIVSVFQNPKQDVGEPAMVAKVGPRLIQALGFVDGSDRMRTYWQVPGLRHADDPDLAKGSEESSMCWRHTPQTLRIEDLERRLQRIEKLLDLEPTESIPEDGQERKAG
jgi:hypothetical protein